MTYFITEAQRKPTHTTCFFEFQKGMFRKQHWEEDSLFLHMDTFDRLNLYPIFCAAIPHFDYCGPNSVTHDQYKLLKDTVLSHGDEIAALFTEFDIWVTECFKTETCFSILGI